ncbi:MAG: hypothetical protein GF329_13995 [Candidatus Lokiarchaeota archaeon]|nr:hypothetical protein [Candidatus Lokiarchaeota archaeon]
MFKITTGLDPVRFFQIYVIQGLIFAVCVFLGYRTLKRNNKRINVIFSGFYFSVAVGLFLNFIYAPLQIEGLETVVLILNFLTNYFISLGPIFFVVFVLLIYKSGKIIDTNKQLLIIGSYAVILFLMVIFLPFRGVIINSTTRWKPVYNLAFFLYLMITLFLGTTVPSLYYAMKIYINFSTKDLKKRWKYFIIGTVFLFLFMYGTFSANFLDIQIFRTIWSLIGLFLVIAGIILIYFGVGRQIEK